LPCTLLLISCAKPTTFRLPSGDCVHKGVLVQITSDEFEALVAAHPELGVLKGQKDNISCVFQIVNPVPLPNLRLINLPPTPPGGTLMSIAKYLSFLKSLEDDIVYAPSLIPVTGTKEEKERARIVFRAFAKRHGFPEKGDGVVYLAFQVRLVGWFGHRWKAALAGETTFAPDEMEISRVDDAWTRADLLPRESLFRLRDITDLLGIDSRVIKKEVEALQAQGQDAWEVMGAKKVMGFWIIRMKAFAPYYKERFGQRSE
ncbi:MAG: hypothetical protein QNK37_38610, partial [Acidobacteriota bacterium]|nr:hypothetical protein [Acidobacteriota bacterium]